jgi:hypothetical protein
MTEPYDEKITEKYNAEPDASPKEPVEKGRTFSVQDVVPMTKYKLKLHPQPTSDRLGSSNPGLNYSCYFSISSQIP